jgi:cytochrome oxidase Cu insertion factor (SCO1/SenC/PrrC family)
MSRADLVEFKPAMPSRRKLILAFALLLIAGMLGATALLLVREGPEMGTALVGGPFTLTDQNGKRVSDTDFAGKYRLMFFGYTFCPDVCPTELQVMTAALQSMGPKAEAIQPIFITIDPARDTPEVLKSYLSNFDPRFVGLTGTEAEIAAVTKAYRFYSAKVAGKGEDYLFDHSGFIYLMGPDGRFLKHFAYSTDAVRLATDLQSLIR